MMLMIRNSIFLIACILAFSIHAQSIPPKIEPSYHWGRGLDIPWANLNLGGYVSVEYKDLESGQDELILDDLSLFVSWRPHAKIRFFSELEMEGWLSNHGVTGFSRSFSLERLYLDYLYNDSLSFRFGQFLTPVGRWNITHAAPLVWTSTRPMVTQTELFPLRVNGLMLNKQLLVQAQTLNISVYLDDSNVLDPRRITDDEEKHNDPETAFKRAAGLYLQHEFTDQFMIGLAYLAFKKRDALDNATNHLWGLDVFWQKNGYELQVEMAYRYAPDRQGHEQGGFVQGVAPLVNKFFAVGRYEYLSGRHQIDNRALDRTLHVGVVGLAWRPFVPLVIKTEYRFGHNNPEMAPSGLFASVSMFY